MSNGGPSRTLATVPQRRQNSSCDPCRRSKRRCTFPLDTLEISSPACVHCQRLGHHCTFNFATSRRDLKSRRKQRKQDSTTLNTLQSESNCFEVSHETTDSIHVNCENVFDEWLNIDNSPSPSNNGSSSNLNYPTDDSISGPGSPTTDGDQNLQQVALAPRHLRKQNHSLPLSAGSLLGVSRRSPICLLNSKLDETILDTRLAQIFETIISGCALRYLDYDCNLYATQSRYRLESSTTSTSPASPETDPTMDESCADSRSLESQLLSPHGSDQPSTHLHASDERMIVTPAREGACNITIVGCARFLDHLAGLYGNKLNPAAQRQSNETLNATLRLFALQWMPSAKSSSDPQLPSNRHSSLEAYTDTWFNVRSRVLASQHIRSFRVVLAIFMFDGTAIPSKARESLGSTKTDHEFLDVGLRTLCLLNQLVVQYCATLGPFSRYSRLADASLSLVRWCGYMRDLGAALTASHKCKLPALFARGNDTHDITARVQPVYHGLRDLDGRIPSICHAATAHSFSIWREIIDVRESLLKLDDVSSGIPKEICEAVYQVMRNIQLFHDIFQTFMHDCTQRLGDISLASKLSAVSMTMFWNLGILVLADSLLPFIEGIGRSCNWSVDSELQSCRQIAVSSIAQVIESVSALPNEASFNILNGLSPEVPIIGYHVTPSLMTSALAKAVEHSILLRVSNIGTLDNVVGHEPTGCDDPGARIIDTLVKGLLSLDVTIGGSQTAGVAFQSLMRRYGDIISEYWYC